MLLALSWLGCASNRDPATRPKPPESATNTAEPSAGKPGQWLFRAEISGEEGSGSLRLLLRRIDAEHFTLVAADALGQARWEIRREAEKAVWIDPAAQRFCRLDPLRPLQARLSVPSIPLTDFPGLLTGDWPPPSAVRGADAPPEAFTRERPFTGERSGSERAGASEPRWSTWTLWEGSEPVAWFKRVGQDSLLSVRRPAVQVRWRATAASALDLESRSQREETAAPAASWPGDLPAGFREMACPENAIP